MRSLDRGVYALGLARRRKAPPIHVGQAGLSRAVRYGYCLVLGLGIGFQFSGYLVWAEGAKTPEGGAVAVVVTVLSVLTLLRWTR